jgi:hypothetical protein
MRDRRYMRVTSFLLERRGYDVVQEGGSNIFEAAARFRADVVLLEAERSRGSLARTIAALAALPAPPRVITVVDREGTDERLPGIATLAKWTPIDDVAREIDAAFHRRDTPLARPTSLS